MPPLSTGASYRSGVDIKKFEFISNIHGTKVTKSYTNDEEGINIFYQEHQYEKSFDNKFKVVLGSVYILSREIFALCNIIALTGSKNKF